METKTDSKTLVDDGKTQEGIEFNKPKLPDNGDNKKSNLSVEKLISGDQSPVTSRNGGANPAKKPTRASTKSPVSTKTLSFSIERMLNLNKNPTHIKEERPSLLTSDNKSVTTDSTTEKVNLKTDSQFVRKEDNDRDDDCDSNDEDDDGMEVEDEGYLVRQRHGGYPNSHYFRHDREDMPRSDLLPLEINSRPMWPSFFSYLGPQWSETSRDRYGLIRRVGHPYQNRTPPKRKKPRTAFTRQQVMELEKRFSRQKYLASAERSSLAKGLNMSDSQVKTWFQNRRTKWRRQTAEEREMERQAAKKFLLSIQRDESQPLYSPLCATPSHDRFHPSLSHSIDVRYIDQN